MSAPNFAWAIDQGRIRKLVPSDRLVLIALANRANGLGYCWPGRPTLAGDTGLSARTVHTSAYRLQAEGLIRMELRGRCTYYFILRSEADAEPEQVQPLHDSPPEQVQPLHQSHPPSVQPLHQSGSEQMQQLHDNRCNQQQMNGAAVAPKTTKETTKKTETRARPREGKVFHSDFGRKEVAAAPPAPEREPTAREIEAARAKAAAELAGLPDGLRDVFQSLGSAMAGVAYAPGRSSSLSRDEQLAVLNPRPKIKPAYLSPEQLPMRNQLYRRVSIATDQLGT